MSDLYAMDEALAMEAADIAAGHVYRHLLDEGDSGSAIDALAVVISLVLIALIVAGRLPV
ncbi:hypothetical protein [Azohydromonas lata]|uniref:hypothetical protein n=1 Tax=Azohydromonas lata TaxID=45677 RepID=UPI00082AF53B|nr:hypothetical protein [Azohydromonas lata]